MTYGQGCTDSARKYDVQPVPGTLCDYKVEKVSGLCPNSSKLMSLSVRFDSSP